MIAPRGDLDEGTLPPLETQIREAVHAYGGLVLDASHITFGDSTFLRFLPAPQ